MKDPAFLFYPNDYIGGTMGMTFEEKGAYIELLMMQFNRGHMTSHMVGQLIGQIWVNIQHKFIQDAEGLWYNERLEIEINNRKSYTESRKNNLLGVNQYTKKEENNNGHMNGHMSSHMENEDEDINNSNNGVKKFTAPIKEEVTNYFKEKGYKPEVGARAWESYDVANWHDSKGQKIRNWKQKMINVWFKDENKIVIRPQDKLL